MGIVEIQAVNLRVGDIVYDGKEKHRKFEVVAVLKEEDRLLLRLLYPSVTGYRRSPEGFYGFPLLGTSTWYLIKTK